MIKIRIKIQTIIMMIMIIMIIILTIITIFNFQCIYVHSVSFHVAYKIRN